MGEGVKLREGEIEDESEKRGASKRRGWGRVRGGGGCLALGIGCEAQSADHLPPSSTCSEDR